MKIFVSVPENTIVYNTFFSQEVREYLEARAQITYSPYPGQITPEQFAQTVKGFDVVMTGWRHPKITWDMIKDTGVKLIVHTGGSVGDYVDPEVYDHGIRVFSGNMIYAESVAEGTIAYMLMGLRYLPDYVNRIRAGGWRFGNDNTKGLMDRTVGLIGMGAIATFVAKKLTVFGAKLKFYSSYPIDETLVKECNAEVVSLEEAMQCDVVSLHSAMNDRTRGMIGAEQLKLVKDGALFVNTARARIVDEDALVEELKKQRFYAVLDVHHHEPLEENSPFRMLENVYCIPHMAGPTIDLRPIITKRLMDNVKLYEEGKPAPLEISKEYHARMTVGG